MRRAGESAGNEASLRVDELLGREKFAQLFRKTAARGRLLGFAPAREPRFVRDGPIRPGRVREPRLVRERETQFAAPAVVFPRLRAVDEMLHDRVQFLLEIEQEEIAHEIVARRQRREAAGESDVERALLHEFEAARRSRRACAARARQLLRTPLGAVDRHQPRIEIGRREIERPSERR